MPSPPPAGTPVVPLSVALGYGRSIYGAATARDRMESGEALRDIAVPWPADPPTATGITAADLALAVRALEYAALDDAGILHDTPEDDQRAALNRLRVALEHHQEATP